jgi:hypothetical protein
MRINDKVELLLKANQRNRDSDKALLLAVWEIEGLHLSDTQKSLFMNCTSAETITRARRALKEKYPASEKVDNQRFEKFQEYKYKRPFEYVVRED